MNVALQQALDAARAQLAIARTGELSLGAREIVWAALGPRATPPRPGRPVSGHVTRAGILFRACERALPLWQDQQPGDELPERVLGLARLALVGEASEDEAKTAAGRLWGRTENLSQLAGDPNRLAVGFACCKAVDVALYDEVFDPNDLDARRTSSELDLFEVDGAYLVALAEAGGPPGAASADASVRREFWTWWLAECGRHLTAEAP